MKMTKCVIVSFILAIMCIALYASFTVPVRWDICGYKYYRHSAFYDVTYQAKNIYGMKLGEEYTVSELTPRARGYN